MSGLDQFFADASRNTDAMIAARQRADEKAYAQRLIDGVAAERDRAINDSNRYIGMNAGNLALRVAAIKALEQVDPTHPLVRDAALRERIIKVAKDTINATNDWDEVREVGRTFQIPGRS
jgi:hypothetical protein